MPLVALSFVRRGNLGSNDIARNEFTGPWVIEPSSGRFAARNKTKGEGTGFFMRWR